MKLPVINTEGQTTCPVATIAFLALVIRYARAWLYTQSELGPTLLQCDLKWEFNIGCPTKPHDKPEVVSRLKKIAEVAWAIAAEDAVRSCDIETAWEIGVLHEGLASPPSVVPEFLAQIAGYLTSSQVRNGLHALIDIGAGTVDAAGFNVVLAEPNMAPPTIPIFNSAVVPLGTHYLTDRRHRELGLDLTWDDTANVEDSPIFALRHGVERDAVERVDGAFASDVAKRIHRVLDAIRTNERGAPRSPAWRQGLGIFITGGGAHCGVYRRAIDKVEERLKGAIGLALGAQPFRFIPLDAGFSESARWFACAGRLSVAFGLTEDADNLGRIIQTGDLEVPQRPRPPEPDKPDRDDLYAK